MLGNSLARLKLLFFEEKRVLISTCLEKYPLRRGCCTPLREYNAQIIPPWGIIKQISISNNMISSS
jgi:hypothetical protein